MHTKRGVTFEIKDGDKGSFVAIFATFGVKDHDGDVTRPDAFEDGAKMPVSAYGHGSWMGRLPVGKAVIKTTDKEAQAHGQFFMDTQDGHDTFVTVKRLHEDGMGEWSYGYDPVKVSYGEWPEEGDDPKEQVRFLEKQKVHEVSPVLLGAGIGTSTVSAKGLDLVTEEDMVALLQGKSPEYVKRVLPEETLRQLVEMSTKSDESSIDDSDATIREFLRYQQFRFAKNEG